MGGVNEKMEDAVSGVQGDIKLKHAKFGALSIKHCSEYIGGDGNATCGLVSESIPASRAPFIFLG